MPRNEKDLLVWEYEGGATNAEARPDRARPPRRRDVPGGMTSGTAAFRLRRAVQFCLGVTAALGRRAAPHAEP